MTRRTPKKLSKNFIDTPTDEENEDGYSLSHEKNDDPMSAKSFKSAQLKPDLENYATWSIRLGAYLRKHSQWNIDKPSDSKLAADLLIDAISDALLDTMTEELPLNQQLSSTFIWQFIQNTLNISTLTSQNSTLLKLVSFEYDCGPVGSMQQNKTKLKKIGREISTAFANKGELASSVPISKLLIMFGMCNLPTEFDVLKTTIEETKTDLTIDELFESLIREEAKTEAEIAKASRANRAAKASTANSFTSAESSEQQCRHNFPADKCWTCNENLRPVCAPCQGKRRPFFHPAERCPESRKSTAKKATAKVTKVAQA